jgi:NAD(P)-dependent dehydrogenase (short-subunit alcohol dehydrogenase family)
MPNAVITGSSSGIGAGIRERLEAQGFDVTGIDLKGSEINADLSTAAGRKTAIDHALEKTGGQVDRLVLAAGLGGHLEDGQLVARVNYFGVVDLLDGFKDALATSGGRVVVISSNSAQMRVDPNHDILKALLDGKESEAMDLIGDMHSAMIYPMSKQAVARDMRRRASDWGKLGIRLNAIAPGITETAMVQGVKDHPQLKHSLNAIPVPLDRFAQVDEIANVIDFMLSDGASYMHGSVIYVDGGTDAFVRPDTF